MSSTAATAVLPNERLEVLFAELSELAGQRNAIDGRIVEIAAEMDRDKLCGATGARSIAELVAWKLGYILGQRQDDHHGRGPARGVSPLHRELRKGRLSLDQVGVIAARAADGSDEHYAQLAAVATVSQLRTAVKLEPRPDPDPRPDPEPSITKGSDERFSWWRIRLAHAEAAKVEAALGCHREALIAEWRHAHDNDTGDASERPPMPGNLEAFMRLVEAGWDTEAARRPHGQHTTVVVHVDVEARAAALHLGPLLSDAERQYLSCDASCEVWFERNGRPIGVGRAPAPSVDGCAAPWSTATRPARSPAVGPPEACTPITFGIGKTAAPPNSKTLSCFVRSIIGRITAATSPSPDPPTI